MSRAVHANVFSPGVDGWNLATLWTDYGDIYTPRAICTKLFTSDFEKQSTQILRRPRPIRRARTQSFFWAIGRNSNFWDPFLGVATGAMSVRWVLGPETPQNGGPLDGPDGPTIISISSFPKMLGCYNSQLWQMGIIDNSTRLKWTQNGHNGAKMRATDCNMILNEWRAMKVI